MLVSEGWYHNDSLRKAVPTCWYHNDGIKEFRYHNESIMKVVPTGWYHNDGITLSERQYQHVGTIMVVSESSGTTMMVSGK